eukprot:4572358-Alexandrium_andersonii.AAC.1
MTQEECAVAMGFPVVERRLRTSDVAPCMLHAMPTLQRGVACRFACLLTRGRCLTTCTCTLVGAY